MRVWLCSPLGMPPGAGGGEEAVRWSRTLSSWFWVNLWGWVGVLVDGVPVVAEIFQGQLEALIAKGLNEVIGDP